MDDETEYRIEFTIQRKQPGDEDFTDIGFGSSGGWTDPEQCAHMVESAVQNWEWETERGMPEPESVREDIALAKGI